MVGKITITKEMLIKKYRYSLRFSWLMRTILQITITIMDYIFAPGDIQYGCNSSSITVAVGFLGGFFSYQVVWGKD